MSDGLEWVFSITDNISPSAKVIASNFGKLDSQAEEATSGLGEFSDAAADVSKQTKNMGLLGVFDDLSKITIGANQTLDLLSKVSDSLSFANEISKTETDFARLGISGNELTEVAEKSFLLQQRFGSDADEIRKAANSMAQNLGGSLADNLDLLEQGYLKGADLNGEMLKSMEEYSGFIANIGLTGEEALAFMTEANRRGIFQDKAFDALKEGNISLNEMGKAQTDALAGIGLLADDLKDKTLFESMQLVAQSMEGMNAQAQQAVISDIFRGAGEDAVGLFDLLRNFKGELSEFESIEPPGDFLNKSFAQVKFWVGDAVSGMMPFIDSISGIGMAVMGLGPMFSGLMGLLKSQRIATVLLTAKQWLLNVAMNANPIGLIIAGIAALIAALVAAYKNFDWFRGIVHGAWEGLKAFGSVLWDSVLSSIKGLLDGISGVGAALKHLFAGEFSEAADAGIAAVQGFVKASPMGMAAGVVENFGKVGEAAAKGYQKGVAKGMEEEALADPADPAGSVPIRPLFSPTSNATGGLGGGETATAIATGGKKQQIFNIQIDKVLESVTQEISNGGRDAADELVDLVLDRFTRRLNGTFRSLAN